MHAYLCSIDRERSIDSSNLQTRKFIRCFTRNRFCTITSYRTRRRTRRRVHAKTRRTRVVANLRNEAIARVVPSVRRAYARSFRRLDARRLPRWREQRDERERERAGISLAPRERLVASSVLVGVAASRINGTGNMKQRARAWTHYTDGRETREYVLPPTITCQNMPLPWSLRAP